MITLRIELQVRDFDLWQAAFDRDAAGRQRHGKRRYRVFRPVDDTQCVLLDGDFDTKDEAERFLDTMRNDVWPSPEKAPAKIGTPKTRLLDVVRAEDC